MLETLKQDLSQTIMVDSAKIYFLESMVRKTLRNFHEGWSQPHSIATIILSIILEYQLEKSIANIPSQIMDPREETLLS